MPEQSELDALYVRLEKACTGDYVLSRSERYIEVHEDDLHAFVRQFETEREKLKARFVEVFHADAQRILHGEATALEKALTEYANLQAERDRLGAALASANAIIASEADEKTALDARATVAESACELHERIAKSMGVRLNDCEAQIQRLTTCEFHGEHTGETTGCCAHRRADAMKASEPTGSDK